MFTRIHYEKGLSTVGRHCKFISHFQVGWKSSSKGKAQILLWLLLKDRLNTRNLLRRKSMDILDYNGVLCSAPIERNSDPFFFWMLVQPVVLEIPKCTLGCDIVRSYT